MTGGKRTGNSKAIVVEVGIMRIGAADADTDELVTGLEKSLTSPDLSFFEAIPSLKGGLTVHGKEIRGLVSGSAYAVLSRLRGEKGTSDAVLLRTLRSHVRYTEVYRVSEYTYEVDLLDNHDSASHDAQAGFLTSTNDNDFFKLEKAPVTRYCVEHYTPQEDEMGRVTGYAPYVSCNGPEADPRNSPSDPLCICDVYPDRLIGLQNKSQMDSECKARHRYS